MSCDAVPQPDGRCLLSGAIDFDCAPEVHHKVLAVLAEADAELVVDFAALAQTNTAALSLMLCWKRAAARQGKAIRFCNPPAALRAMARVSELESLLEIPA